MDYESSDDMADEEPIGRIWRGQAVAWAHLIAPPSSPQSVVCSTEDMGEGVDVDMLAARTLRTPAPPRLLRDRHL